MSLAQTPWSGALGPRHADGYVLVVEDDPDIRECVVELLRDFGCAALTASNGQEAMDLLPARGAPLLILLDQMMPVMNGEEFLAQIAASASFKRVPVCVMSASPRFVSSNDVVAFLPKPFDEEALIDVVRRHCSHLSGPH
jgi:CheY-like chemotaxis protein